MCWETANLVLFLLLLLLAVVPVTFPVIFVGPPIVTFFTSPVVLVALSDPRLFRL